MGRPPKQGTVAGETPAAASNIGNDRRAASLHHPATPAVSPSPPPAQRQGRRLRRRRPAVVFPIDIITTLIDAAVVVMAYIMTQIAFSAVAYILGGMVTDHFMAQLADVPEFAYRVQGGQELGNATWAVYEQLRWLSYAGLGVVVVAAAVVRFLDSGGMLPGEGEGTTSGVGTVGRSRGDRMLLQCLGIAVFLAAFPLMWDVASAAMESATLYVANPHYSQNPDWPCTYALYDHPETWERLYHSSPYIEDHAKALNSGAAPDLLNPDGSFPPGASPVWAGGYEQLCDPNLKFSYVMDKITGVPEFDLPDDINPIDWVGLMLSGGFTGALMFTFFGVLRALVVIQAAMIAFLSLILTDLFTSMVIAAMPLLLVLGLVPQARPATEKLLLSLPGLYMVPMIAALVVSVGAGAVADAGNASISTETIGPISGAVLYTWFVAIGVLFMAAGVPLMMVPLISSVMMRAQGVASSAASTAAMVTGRAVVGGAKGMGGGGGIKGALAGFAGGTGSGIAGATGMPGGGGGGGGEGGGDSSSDDGGASAVSGFFSSIMGGSAGSSVSPIQGEQSEDD